MIKPTHMKYVILLMSCGYGHAVLAQNYLDGNPEWKEFSIVCGGGNPYCSTSDYTITLDGDTLISGVLYFKLRRQGSHRVWDWTVDTLVSEGIIDDCPYPLIREDQGRFYTYNSQGSEQLLHDFNLNVGDTAVSSSSCPNPQIVMEIDTMYYGNQIRKKFIFAPQLTFGGTPLYEGIGSSRGLFARPCSGTFGIEFGSRLECYVSHGEAIQLDTSAECQSTPSAIEDIATPGYHIYPNPFNDRIVIENRSPNSNLTHIDIYDFYGHLIKPISRSTIENEITISTQELVAGVYFLKIYTRYKFHTIKMIKL
jgi:hypothetical protein